MKKFLFLVIPFILLACEKDAPGLEALGSNSGIIGTWVEETDLSLPTDGLTRLSRAGEFSPHHYGFTFHEDGSFTERKNSGWCGTPPVAYDNFDGTWNPLNDTVIDITVAYWGGTMTYQMWIVSLEGDHLGIRYLFSEDRVEAK